MCDPFSFAATISAASAVMKGVGGALSGFANADALEGQAKARQEKAKYDIEQAERKFQRVQGTAINAAASTGIDMRSFYDVLTDNKSEAALEQAAIKWGADRDSANLKFQASAARTNGIFSAIGGALDAAGSFKKTAAMGVKYGGDFGSVGYGEY